MPSVSRRQFLRSAGGLSFLALSPVGRGLFGAPARIRPLDIPLFTALPYIQPGPEGRLIPGGEIVRLAWQTVRQPAEFEVRFGSREAYDRAAPVERSQRLYRGKNEREDRFNYVCSFPGLNLGAKYRYRVRCNGERIAEGYFTTRQPRGAAIRFVSFGDNSFGEVSDRAIAYQAYCAHPDFVMNTGDNVYEHGLDNEYTRYFFSAYNADAAGPRIGAPLLRSVPFYSVLGNHDVPIRQPGVPYPFVDFAASPDSLGYYTNFYFPANGPAAPAHPPPLYGPAGAIADFKMCAADRFPRMANYAYDFGDAHFLCFDSNTYIDPTDPALTAWIGADLGATDARWKFVVCHYPPFNIGVEHYHEQHIRALAPLFEKHGVDFVLGGHEHNYQRSVPLRFAPGDLKGARRVGEKTRLVPGEFRLDTRFDGQSVTRPDGVIYIVTGAGGKYLYDAAFTNHPEKWTWAEDGHAAYVAQVAADRHSLSVIDIDGGRLTFRQVDERGDEIDRIVVTKA